LAELSIPICSSKASVLYLSSEQCDPCSSNYLPRCQSFRKLSTTSAERESLANGRARPSRRLRTWPQRGSNGAMSDTAQ
jgi:hypothetical protein